MLPPLPQAGEGWGEGAVDWQIQASIPHHSQTPAPPRRARGRLMTQGRSFKRRVGADLTALSKHRATPSRRLQGLNEQYWLIAPLPLAGEGDCAYRPSK
jgi:hypothetical protein